MSATAAVIVMGVAGSGKTTVGQALAVALGWRFVDADDYHDPTSIAKMARGEPLDDRDRDPWLDRLRTVVVDAVAGAAPVVLACSALRASYRTRLAGPAAGSTVRFVYLDGPAALFRERLMSRQGHFMRAEMLPSQLETLEPPEPGEALVVDAARPPAALVREIRTALGL